MATALKNLSSYEKDQMPIAKGMRFGIVVAEWNDNITDVLANGALKVLLANGVKETAIKIEHVPGTVELTFAAKLLAQSVFKPDAIICLGCVIKGDTPHFDYVCLSVTQGITQLNIDLKTPVIFGVLTTDNLQQALDRAGGKHGNKGDEAAVTAIKMVALSKNLNKKK